MTALRMLLWACSLVFAAWATAEAAGNYLETREIEWILGTLTGIALFGMVMVEFGKLFQDSFRDD